MRSEPRVTLICGKCLRRHARPWAGAQERECPRCGDKTAVTARGRTTETGAVKICFACGCGHLYREKDFNAVAGFAVLLAAVILYLVFSGQPWAVAILVAAGLLDAAAYLMVGRRSICYKCMAEYRGFPSNPAHEPFDLGVGSRFSDSGDGRKGA